MPHNASQCFAVVKPKKLTGYQLFANEQRLGIKITQPGATFGEVSQTISTLWNGMKPSEKTVYTEKAEEMGDSVVRNPLTGGVDVSKTIEAHGRRSPPVATAPAATATRQAHAAVAAASAEAIAAAAARVSAASSTAGAARAAVGALPTSNAHGASVATSSAAASSPNGAAGILAAGAADAAAPITDGVSRRVKQEEPPPQSTTSPTAGIAQGSESQLAPGPAHAAVACDPSASPSQAGVSAVAGKRKIDDMMAPNAG
jgi:hypothetical protein